MLKAEIFKTFSGFQLDLKFTAAPGITALFGPSGAGKSLTLKCISGLLHPDRGEISLNGKMLFNSTQKINLPPQKRKIGYVFQNYALFPHLSVKENIIYGIKHLPRQIRQEKLDRLLETMRLQGFERKKPGEISGGQQQRVALARTLAADPEMILLDEPFSALDSGVKSRLRAELLDILMESGIPALLVTHDLNEAYSLSNNLTIIEGGRILQSDDKKNVIATPVNTTVARLVRTKNIFSGVVENISGENITVATSAGPLYLYSQKNLTIGQEVHLFIRPHHIQIYGPGETAVPSINVFPCMVEKTINHIDGHTVFLKKTTGSPLGKEMVYAKITEASFHKSQPVIDQPCLCYFPPEFIGVVD